MLYKNFEGWEIRHLFKRSKLFGLPEDIQNSLSLCGWKLSKGKKLTKDQADSLDSALYRLTKISNLEKTCTRKKCRVCSKIASFAFRKPDSGKLWCLGLELWRWQKECSETWWKNGCEGIVKVVTGAGKTVLALSLMENLKNKDVYSNDRLKIIIVVPTTALLDQWYQELVDQLSVPESDIGLFYSEEKDDIKNTKVMI